MKLWLLNITQNRKDDIEEMTRDIYPTFDGIIAVDHESDDGTYELLEERKGAGKIIRRPFIKNHSHSMNELLFCRHMENGDWALFLDSPERMTPKFLSEIKQTIENLKSAQLAGIYMDGRPYLFQYFDHEQFFGSPHWGLNGLGNCMSLDKSVKPSLIINKREEEPVKSYCLNPIKYWYVYNPSNECQIMYAHYGRDVFNYHENQRLQFRLYCQKQLGLSLDTLDELIEYMRKENNPSDYFKEVVEQEFRLTDLYRIKVLGQDFMNDVVPNRYNWSFKYYLETGDDEQLFNKVGSELRRFTGKINEYNKRIGRKEE